MLYEVITKFTLEQKGGKQDAVAFCYKDMHALIPGRADFLCEPGIDSFTNRTQLIVRDMAFYQDEALAGSFLQVHSDDFTQGFLDEVILLGQCNGGDMSEAEFICKLDAAMHESRFGLCINVRTVPAFRHLISLAPVKEALRHGRLMLWDDKAFSPDNCIACGEAAGHTRMLHAGVNRAP